MVGLRPARRHGAYFGCPVLFDREYDCLAYDAKLLAQPVVPLTVLAGERIDDAIRKRIACVEDSLENQVRSLILQLVGSRQHTLENIAAMLGMQPRTLQRRLCAEGLRFKELVSDAKLNTACWHLQASRVDITGLSDALGYQSVAAFSKAFKNKFDQAPSQWRREHGGHILRSPQA